jgi:hypothetical protein
MAHMRLAQRICPMRGDGSQQQLLVQTAHYACNNYTEGRPIAGWETGSSAVSRVRSRGEGHRPRAREGSRSGRAAILAFSCAGRTRRESRLERDAAAGQVTAPARPVGAAVGEATRNAGTRANERIWDGIERAPVRRGDAAGAGGGTEYMHAGGRGAQLEEP